MLINGATAHSDVVTLLQKMREFAVKVPMIGLGAQFTTQEFRDGVGAELIEGLMATVASHTLKGQDDLVKRFQERTKRTMDDARLGVGIRRDLDGQRGHRKGRFGRSGQGS